MLEAKVDSLLNWIPYASIHLSRGVQFLLLILWKQTKFYSRFKVSRRMTPTNILTKTLEHISLHLVGNCNAKPKFPIPCGMKRINHFHPCNKSLITLTTWWYSIKVITSSVMQCLGSSILFCPLLGLLVATGLASWNLTLNHWADLWASEQCSTVVYLWVNERKRTVQVSPPGFSSMVVHSLLPRGCSNKQSVKASVWRFHFHCDFSFKVQSNWSHYSVAGMREIWQTVKSWNQNQSHPKMWAAYPS